MKRLLFVLCLCGSVASAGDWITVGGNNRRDGQSSETGPASPNVLWTKPSVYSIWGNQIFVYGDKFVTTRYVSLSPIRALLACHSLTTGDTLWTRNYAPNGVMIVMGFNNNQIYARNFQQQGFDTIYAINPQDGSALWQSRFTVERGIIWTAVFTTNGDLIVPGSGTRSIMRINHLTGDTVWTRYRPIPNTGAEGMCIRGNTLYAWEGSLITPKRIMALNAENGSIMYYSAALPGDGDQEIPMTVSSTGVVYALRDGGNLHALHDSGNAFVELWQHPYSGMGGTYMQVAVGNDGSVYIPKGRRIYRLSSQTGAAMDSSEEVISTGTINARFAIGANGTVYMGNGASSPSEGKYFAFTPNLQTLWSVSSPYNYYSGPALGQNGTLLFCGGGTDITAYRTPTSVNLSTALVPAEPVLMQNYPNPFNPSTAISYRLPAGQTGLSAIGLVSLKVYDVLGCHVATLAHETKTPGEYTVTWDATGMPGGVYFCRLQSGGRTLTRKLILMK